MTIEVYREEHRQVEIGPLLWSLILEVCRRVAPSYPPSAYNDGAPWADEGFENLAQETVLERLLGENQLAYLFHTATDEGSLAKLIAHQAKRVLAHRRSKTVVDRLTKRIRQLADSDGAFSQHPLGRDAWIAAAGTSGDQRTLSEAELRRGADLISSIPRIPTNPRGSRESMVYSAQDLGEVLQRLVAEFGWVSLGDLRKILDILLTAWLPTILYDYEEDQKAGSPVDLEIDRAQMDSLIDTLIADFNNAHLVILVGKSQDIADGALATRLGRSRPWVADRKAEVLSLIEGGLISQLPVELHPHATRELIDRAAVLVEQLP